MPDICRARISAGIGPRAGDRSRGTPRYPKRINLLRVSGAPRFWARAHFVAEIHLAARHSSRTIAVLSKAYRPSVFATEERQAAWVADPSGRERRLLAFRVADCAREGYWGSCARWTSLVWIEILRANGLWLASLKLRS